MTVKLAPFYGHKNPNAPLLQAQFAPLAKEKGGGLVGKGATWWNCATCCHTDYCQDYDGLRLLVVAPFRIELQLMAKMTTTTTQQPQQQHKQHKQQQQLQQVPT